MSKVVTYLVASICLFFSPIHGLLLAVGMAIVLDTFFGIYRAVKVKGWKFVTSRRLSEIISKMVLYQSCILSLFVIDKYLLSEFFKIWFSTPYLATKIAAIVLIFIEMVSIKENFEKATGLDVWSLFKKTLGRAKEVKDGINDITN